MTANTPPEAPGARVGDEHRAPVSVGGATPVDARERRYAEAIGRQRCEGGANWLQEARAAIAIADWEQAQLKAENEALRGALLKASPAIARIAMLREERDAARSEVERLNRRHSRLTTLDASSLKREMRRAEAAERDRHEALAHSSASLDLVLSLLQRTEQARDEALAEIERLRGNTAGLYERAHAAEARESRLREAVEGLAVEWEWTPGTVLPPSSAAAAYEQGIADCTEALRALLAAQEPPAATEADRA